MLSHPSEKTAGISHFPLSTQCSDQLETRMNRPPNEAHRGFTDPDTWMEGFSKNFFLYFYNVITRREKEVTRLISRRVLKTRRLCQDPERQPTIANSGCIYRIKQLFHWIYYMCTGCGTCHQMLYVYVSIYSSQRLYSGKTRYAISIPDVEITLTSLLSVFLNNK